jgi:hypothetical protein
MAVPIVYTLGEKPVRFSPKWVPYFLGFYEYNGARAIAQVFAYVHKNRPLHLDMGLGTGEREYSEQTAQEIDQEKNRIIDETHRKVLLKLKNYSDPLRKFAGILLEKESIDGEELRKFAEEIRIQAAAGGEPIEAPS